MSGAIPISCLVQEWYVSKEKDGRIRRERVGWGQWNCFGLSV